MRKFIELNSNKIEYILRKNRRAKRLCFIVHKGGEFVVTAPKFLSQKLIEKYILQKSEWIITKIDEMKLFKKKVSAKDKIEDFKKYKLQALKVTQEKLKYFNQFYNFKYNKVTIRNQTSRWGSCSKSANLSFNYRIAFLKDELADYLIVHELCHLKEFNHSIRFWNLVGKTIPNYLELRKLLKEIG